MPINNVFETQKGYHLFLIYDENNYQLLRKKLSKRINNSLDYDDHILHNLDLFKEDENFIQSEALFIVSHTNDNKHLPLSFNKMHKLKKSLFNIDRYKIDYQLVVILYYLEHPALGINSPFFPKTVNENNKWKIYHIEYNDNIVVQADSGDLRFNLFYRCLYWRSYFSFIHKEKTIKDNVHYVKINYNSSINDMNDYIKLDSIKKVNDEFDTKIIYNRISNIYKVQDKSILKGEFTGAISSCGDNDYSIPLKKLLQRMKDKDVDIPRLSLLCNKLFIPFEQLALLGSNKKCNSDLTYKNYLRTVISVVYNIVDVNPNDYSQVSEKDAIKPDNNFFNFQDTINQAIDKCYFKIIDLYSISPKEGNKDRFKMVLEFYPYHDETKKLRINFCQDRDKWKDIFPARNINIGSIMCFKNFRLECYLAHYDKTLSENKELKEIFEFNDNEKKVFIKNEEDLNVDPQKLCFNPKYCLRKLKSNISEDYFGIAHGDANLNNILIISDNFSHKDSSKSSSKIDKIDYDHIQTMLIDFASFGDDYPLAFDMVKMEVEIKNHIIAECVKDNCGNSHKNFIKASFNIEQYLNSANVFEEIDCSTILEQIKCSNFFKNKNQHHIAAMIAIILKVRKKAFKRYMDTNVTDNIQKLYLQQLFFYNLRTLSYDIEEKTGKCWALISSIIAAGEAFKNVSHSHS